ncbi:hypothetical protein CFter6_2863 [Collimonas fungivorans]|uniref:Uncharacterized protein n=1 Tax=Collimonas fungivorans TaxID=158899 RepID=A0A127PCK5_9BURK|nr:hypothetical protein CFter6_2863 [Collimonas fungivorans]
MRWIDDALMTTPPCVVLSPKRMIESAMSLDQLLTSNQMTSRP